MFWFYLGMVMFFGGAILMFGAAAISVLLEGKGVDRKKLEKFEMLVIPNGFLIMLVGAAILVTVFVVVYFKSTVFLLKAVL
ncbi:MAG: hypothetical protein D6698_15460 [Gammaproteobacteria bacterium]|nr:MAG: hypothetical protein D6698_15460 [Gammaproteobacteria bacterium]